MDNEWYTHFHAEERPFVDRAYEWIEKASTRHDVKITDFLDPRQQVILENIASRYGDIQVLWNGGYSDSERKRAMIAPDYRTLDDALFGILVLSISSDDPHFQSLEHGDFLGAILGLGIKRDKLGDIHLRENGCHCLMTADMLDYVNMNLQQVNRILVHTEILPLEQLKPVSVVFEQIQTTVSSMRLDGIIADIYRLSRAKALIPIRSGKCKVNWKLEENPSALVKEGDVISLKGFGRCKLLQVERVTKKGKIRLTLGKFK